MGTLFTRNTTVPAPLRDRSKAAADAISQELQFGEGGRNDPTLSRSFQWREGTTADAVSTPGKG